MGCIQPLRRSLAMHGLKCSFTKVWSGKPPCCFLVVCSFSSLTTGPFSDGGETMTQTESEQNKHGQTDR